MNDEQITAIAEWVKGTCLLFGSEIQTAHLCAAAFASSLEELREGNNDMQS